MILTVGLTGGLASGKSTAADILAGLGCKVVDADEIVSDLYEPGAAGHAALVEEYGPEILTPAGEIDRAKLASIAFSSEEEARRLNGIIHPLVLAREAALLAEERERAGEEDRIFVVEATLLLEAGGRQRYDRIVVVEAAPSAQIERAVRRGMDREDAERRIRRQMASGERLAQADYVIANTADSAQLEAETRRVHAALVEDLERRKRANEKSPR